MNPHQTLADDDRDRAALYALGAIETDAARVFDAHLAVCALCRAEVDSHRAAIEALGGAVDPVSPPLALKDRVKAAVRPKAEAPAIQTWKSWTPSAEGQGMSIVRGSGPWEVTPVEGIAVRRLFVDAANDRVTMLVRMAAGTSYPAHRHGGIEECYVLEGDLYGPNFEMTAGDYQRLEGESIHGVQGTRGGCLLFIVSSMNDELLPVRP